jgi:hypothetical protein
MRFTAVFTLFLFALVYHSPGHADAIVVNQAMKASTIIQYYVDEDGVWVELEIGIDSIEAFKNLLPDSIYQGFGYDDKPINERHREFFEQHLALYTSDNKPLAGELLNIGPSHRVLRDPINGTPLPIQDDAPQVVRAKLVYRYENDTLPEELVLISPSARDIGFVVYHKGVAVNDFRFLTSGFTITLDWDDPWYSSFPIRNLKRQYSAPMSGFIYVEPFEVRKEIIARPKDLQRWIELGLDGRKTIPVEMQAEIKEKVAIFLAKHHPVSIDNVSTEGILDSINFLERTLTSSRVVDPPVELNLDAAILGAIFVYPQTGLPERVVMEWDLWDERISSVPVSAVDQAGPLPTTLQPDWRELVWENFLKNPIVPTLAVVEPPISGWRILLHKSLLISTILLMLAVLWLAYTVKNGRPIKLPVGVTGLLMAASLASVLMGGSNNPEHDRATAIVGNLLHNIYRSFDYREEADIYDMLDRSVSGVLLTDIFLETKRTLVLANQGGAQARVKEVKLDDLTLMPSGDDASFTAEANWTVAGAVGHWGHVHQRSNRYQALLTVMVDGQQWKLKEMTVLQEERL